MVPAVEDRLISLTTELFHSSRHGIASGHIRGQGTCTEWRRTVSNLLISDGISGRYCPFSSCVAFSLLEALILLHLGQESLELIECLGVLSSGGIIADGSGASALAH